METESEILRDPKFQKMLTTRSRWRWGLSGGLIGAYFAYCLAGVYFNDAFARSVFGSTVTVSLALGYLIIVLAVILSIVYIRVIGRLLEVPFEKPESSK